MTDQQFTDLVIILKRIESHLETLVEIADDSKKGDSLDPELIEQAKVCVQQFDTASASFIQRKLSIGYARAARILDQLEEMGVVGPAEGSTPRKVLIHNS